MGTLGGIVMMFGGVLLFALLLGLVVWLATSGRRYYGTESQRPLAAHSTALDIVRERYARGEIDQEEYKRLLADLKS